MIICTHLEESVYDDRLNGNRRRVILSPYRFGERVVTTQPLVGGQSKRSDDDFSRFREIRRRGGDYIRDNCGGHVRRGLCREVSSISSGHDAPEDES